MKLDILVFAAHPDDSELACSGTILAEIARGKKVGVVDFTRGEMGTRGTPETRDREAKDSAKLLGLSLRANLNFKDVFFQDDEKHQLEVVKMIRKFRPDIVLANTVHDRHIDHGKASSLTTKACFMAGLSKIVTKLDGETQEAWRPSAVYHYIQSLWVKPDFVVDVSPYWSKKMESIKAFKSQFFDPNSQEPETYISSPRFLEFIEARGRELGQSIGVEYGEGYTIERNLGVRSLSDII